MRDVSKAPYSAALNGVTNDAAAIQAALTASAADGQDVYIPRINNAWAFCGSTNLTMAGGFRLYSDGAMSLLWNDSLVGAGLTISQPNAIVENLGFQLPKRATAPAVTRIAVDNQSHTGLLRDIKVGSTGAGSFQGWYIGAKVGMHVQAIENSHIVAHYNAIYSNQTTGFVVFEGSYASGSSGVGQGIALNGGAGASVYGCKIEGPSRNAIRQDDAGANATILISGCWLEGQAGEQIYILGTSSNKVKTAVIQGNFLNGGVYPGGAVSGIFANYVECLETGGNGHFSHSRCGLEVGAAVGNGMNIGEDHYQSSVGGWVNIIRNDTKKERFFGGNMVAKPTSVPVTTAGVHAALVSLGLIT